MLLFSCSVMSKSLGLHGLQHARLPCPSSSPRASSNSCPLSQWWHPAILSSAIHFSCLQSFPTSGSFLMSQLFSSSGQTILALASATVLPINIQDWFHLGVSGLISLPSNILSRVFSNIAVQKSINSLVLSILYGPALTSIHDYRKNHSLTMTIQSVEFSRPEY